MCPTPYEVTMAKTQKARSAAPKGKDSKNGSPLQKSFKKGSRPADAAQQVTRAQNSTFLSYIRSALKSHNDETKSEAEMVHAHYLTLTADQKRGVIAAFFKAGGKKPGLSSVYQQTLTVKNKQQDGTWAGYCTADMLFSFHGVLGHKPTTRRPTQQKHPQSQQTWNNDSLS